MSEVEDEDPLGLRELAVRFDYLLYRINDHVTNLSELTYQSVCSKRDTIEIEYLDKQLQLDKKLKDVDTILRSCDELELELMKLDQMSNFVDDFKERLHVLEIAFKGINV
ncbi:biogenesis of lysosome-related organelles complex 1 subunit Cnl1p [[Candida] anglica]|uniref:Biogenesis of lysosome-related organelles complex 1 subunit CNL1 n=1 Tax=[Candida] anglica TaxID=148631 RepID=A0ABP0EL91_9ASCO